MTDMISEPVGTFHPSRALFRFTILIFVSCLSFGSYFAYDIVSAIAPTLVKVIGAPIVDSESRFTWDGVPEALAYHFQIADNQCFETVHEEVSTLCEASYTVKRSLLKGIKYYWRVRVQDSAGNWGAWSEFQCVMKGTEATLAPNLISPAHGIAFNNNMPRFIWDSVAQTRASHFQIADNYQFDPLYEENDTLSGDSYSIQKKLANDSTYYWRVRVQDSAGKWRVWSEVRSVMIDMDAPPAPDVLSPINGIAVNDSGLRFTWDKVSEARAYHFQIADNRRFDPLYEENTNLSETSYTVRMGLSDERTYYWRVRVQDSATNWGEWSEARSVTIDAETPVAPILTSPSHGVTITDSVPSFTWKRIREARAYHFQVAENHRFDPVYEEDSNLSDISYSVQKGLSDGSTYYWRVRIRDSVGKWKSWSEIRSVMIDMEKPIAPDLISPPVGAARGTVGAFFTMYSVAAILAVLVGGILIDRLGTRKASILFSLLVFSGAGIVWLARSIPIFFIGRFIFGAGSEPLIVAQSAILARWFKNKELALAFGIALTVSRLGTLFAFNTGELITGHFCSFRYALFGAVICCALSVAANVVYIVMDRRGGRALQLKDGDMEEKIVFKDVKEFRPSYWYVTLICVTFYSAIFPFTSLSTDFFVDKWGIARYAEATGGFFYQVFNNFLHMFSTAGGISSIIIFASMILAPFAGRLVDKVGRRATLMIIGSLIMIPSHLLMGVTKIYPAYPMMTLGAAFVLVPAAMWPSVPLIVRKERVGTAFGLMTAIQNIGLALFPLLNGLLRDITQTYASSMVMFASLGLFGLVFAVLLKRADAREGGGLEKRESGFE